MADMMLKPWQKATIVIQSLVIIEFLGVILWALLTESLDVIPVSISIIGFCCGYLFILFKNARRDPVSDERTEKYFERSYMLGGIAGILVIVQLAIVEIITRISFSTIVILIIVVMVFYVTTFITAIVQQYIGGN
ncbi:MAG: hypothetical protein ACFFFH_20005 [Candidatus Thorarchaeota archaeon]